VTTLISTLNASYEFQFLGPEINFTIVTNKRYPRNDDALIWKLADRIISDYAYIRGQMFMNGRTCNEHIDCVDSVIFHTSPQKKVRNLIMGSKHTNSITYSTCQNCAKNRVCSYVKDYFPVIYYPPNAPSALVCEIFNKYKFSIHYNCNAGANCYHINEVLKCLSSHNFLSENLVSCITEIKAHACWRHTTKFLCEEIKKQW